MMTDHRPPQTAVDIDAADLVAVIAQAWDGADGDIWQVDDPEGYANALAAAARWLEHHRSDPTDQPPQTTTDLTQYLHRLASTPMDFSGRALVIQLEEIAVTNPELTANALAVLLRRATAPTIPVCDPEQLIV